MDQVGAGMVAPVFQRAKAIVGKELEVNADFSLVDIKREVSVAYCRKREQNVILWQWMVFLAVFLAGVYQAPAFLVYERPLKTADCVIVMLGRDFSSRKTEALGLIEKGISKNLLIPAKRQVIAFARGKRNVGAKKIVAVAGPKQIAIDFFGKHWNIYENTYLELGVAKKMMEKLGFRSAMVVSSPYHMLRLKLIADRVFTEGGFNVGFKASDLNHYNRWNCFQIWPCPVRVASEYLKLAWFLVSSRFV